MYHTAILYTHKPPLRVSVPTESLKLISSIVQMVLLEASLFCSPGLPLNAMRPHVRTAVVQDCWVAQTSHSPTYFGTLPAY
ncbi:hypothetical protein BD779DRAFT_1557389 [Infundibulicybe gibba]|nr:hypothetical protein BD779DRAFT_1557389 [Infundibulicybe gibba]